MVNDKHDLYEDLSLLSTQGLFWRLWGKAVGIGNYSKKEWKELETRIGGCFEDNPQEDENEITG